MKTLTLITLAGALATGCATAPEPAPTTAAATRCALDPVQRVELDYSVPLRAACANYGLTTPGFAFEAGAPSAEATRELDALASCIRAEPGVDVMLAGPGDAVWQQLVQRGVPADRIWTRSRSTFAVDAWDGADPGLRRVSLTIAPRGPMLAEVHFTGTTASGVETSR